MEKNKTPAFMGKVLKMMETKLSEPWVIHLNPDTPPEVVEYLREKLGVKSEEKEIIKPGEGILVTNIENSIRLFLRKLEDKEGV